MASAGTVKIKAGRQSRITFHEITSEAIQDAVKSGKWIWLSLTARRPENFGQMVGYKLSPLL
jgi:DNA topoisomerase IA